MVNGSLLASGVKVQLQKIRKTIKKIDPNRSSSSERRIYRRTYNVLCPNALHSFFYKHELYKHTQVEKVLKLKHMLSIIRV